MDRAELQKRIHVTHSSVLGVRLRVFFNSGYLILDKLTNTTSNEVIHLANCSVLGKEKNPHLDNLKVQTNET